MRKLALATLTLTVFSLGMLAARLIWPVPPPFPVFAAPPAAISTEPIEEFAGLTLWSQNWSSICLLSGFWAPSGDPGGPIRLRVEEEGAVIRMSARLSLQEISYHMPVGGEVVLDQGWVIINGTQTPVLEPTRASALNELGPNAFRTGESLEWKNVAHIERIELYTGADWEWTEHDHWDVPGFELWNDSAAAGQVLGKLYTPRSGVTDITASGLGTRLHVCETASEPWLEVNIGGL